MGCTDKSQKSKNSSKMYDFGQKNGLFFAEIRIVVISIVK